MKRRALLLVPLVALGPSFAWADTPPAAATATVAPQPPVPSPTEPPFTDTGALKAPAPQPPPPTVAVPTLDAFSYVHPQEKQYLRAVLEVSTVLIVGNVDYLQNTGARGGTVRAGDQRWDLRYDWPDFKDKLSGDLWKVDTNHFNTNYISHPFAGTMYYTSARANHLSIIESWAYTTVGALSWEMFGELREEVSINDVIVTSTAGLTIGEPLMQLSSFFYRSKKRLRNDFFAAFFAPAKAVNDFADGAEHARSANLDENGFTKDEWHRFQVFGGGGVTKQPSGTYADERFGFDLQIVNLPGYEGAAKRTTVFDDGNASGIHFETTLSRGKLADAAFTTRLVPLGIYSRNATQDANGEIRGEGAMLGWLATFEYSVHDYDRDRARPLDLLTVLSPIGIVGEYAYQGPKLHARSRFELSGAFAGVTAYALNDYRVRHNYDDTNLQTVLKQEGYYHSLGVTAATSLELGAGPFDAGGKITLDSWRGISGFDEQQEKITSEISLSDRRLDMRAWVGARIPGTALRVEVLGRQRFRGGDVGEARASHGETSLYGTVGVLF